VAPTDNPQPAHSFDWGRPRVPHDGWRPERRASRPAGLWVAAPVLLLVVGLAVLLPTLAPRPTAPAAAAAERPTPVAVATAVSAPTIAPTPTRPPAPATPTPPCVPPPPYSTGLAAAVEAEVGARAGSYAVAVVNLETGEAYLRNADQRFPAASVYKLAVLYETWRQLQAGTLSAAAELTISPEDAVEPEPDDGPVLGATLSITEALDAMVTVSSNAAAHALLRTVGRDSVNRSMLALGLRDTMVPAPGTSTGMTDGEGEEVAVTSARDAACYLSLLARDQLVGRQASAAMRELLLRQRSSDRLPALLPPTVRVAHKTGELQGVRNDVGIVYAPGGSWAVAALSRTPDDTEATATIGRLSRRLYDYFVGR